MFCGAAFADEMKLNDLYRSYGQLQIQAEIISNQTQQVKSAIANELQKPKEEVKITEEKK
jgi:hypothetical protein